MRRLTTLALALLEGGCMNFDNPLGLDSSGGGGGGGGTGYTGDRGGPNDKLIRFEIEVVSAESLSPVVGASVRVWSWDGSDDTRPTTRVSGTTRPRGIVRGQVFIIFVLVDYPFDGWYLDVEAEGFRPWTAPVNEVRCRGELIQLRVELQVE